MIIEDAAHVLSLVERIKQLEKQIDSGHKQSNDAQYIDSLPGFGLICSSVIAGELGHIDRFEKESSLAMYMGMCALDNSSGVYRGFYCHGIQLNCL